jgi:glutathione S-transferase
MDKHLAGRDWFVGDSITLADIALYAYTHAAEEGEYDLAPFGNVRAWLDRLAGEPGHIPMNG